MSTDGLLDPMANDDCGGQVAAALKIPFPKSRPHSATKRRAPSGGFTRRSGGVHLESIDAKLQFTSDCDKLLPERLYTCKYWSQ